MLAAQSQKRNWKTQAANLTYNCLGWFAQKGSFLPLVLVSVVCAGVSNTEYEQPEWRVTILVAPRTWSHEKFIQVRCKLKLKPQSEFYSGSNSHLSASMRGIIEQSIYFYPLRLHKLPLFFVVEADNESTFTFIQDYYRWLVKFIYLARLCLCEWIKQ